jgi:hypothetical protein
MTRFERGGPQALLRDAPGRGRRASVDASTIRARLEQAHLLASDGQPISLRRAAASERQCIRVMARPAENDDRQLRQ